MDMHTTTTKTTTHCPLTMNCPDTQQRHPHTHSDSRTHTKHSPTNEHKGKTTQVSHMSIKWHPQGYHLRWNKRQLDAYLAIPEVALVQNVEPG
jgi:hypothetical protein